MRKTVTGILLATSVLAMATVQQVQAAEAGSTSASATSNIKAVRFVEFKNGDFVDLKTPLTGKDVTSSSISNHPEIAKYRYSSPREMDGVMYHVYSPDITTDNSNNSSAQSNPYHGGNTAAATNTNTNNNQNAATTSGNSAVKEVRFVVYK